MISLQIFLVSQTRGVTTTILGGFTKRNVSLWGSGGMLPQKNFENYDSTSVNSDIL